MDNIERILGCLDVVSCIGDDKVGDFSMELLSEELRLSTCEGDFLFLTRGHDGFERSCAEILHRLKKLYPRTLCFSVRKYEDQNIYGEEFYDGVIFPLCLKECDKRAIDRYFDDYFLEYTDVFICGKYDPSLDLMVQIVKESRNFIEIRDDWNTMVTTGWIIFDDNIFLIGRREKTCLFFCIFFNLAVDYDGILCYTYNV